MAVRFYEYRLLNEEATPSVKKVIDVLNSSYLNVGTTFELLDALAQSGEDFTIMCYGDFTCEVCSKDCLLGEVSKETWKWLNEILS